MTLGSITLTAVPNIPLVHPGDDLADLIATAIEEEEMRLEDGNVVVITQKIVSKAENRYVDLATVAASHRAIELGGAVGKDPRLVEVILSESKDVIRHRPGLLIVEHRLGFVMANAGVDESNVEPTERGERVLMLPIDPEDSCRRLKRALDDRFSIALGVVMNDSVGRAWRNGSIGMAIGVAGLPSTEDMRGAKDLYGRALRVTEVGLADGIAAAASLLMGEASEGRPVVVVRGLNWTAASGSGAGLVLSKELDLFR